MPDFFAPGSTGFQEVVDRDEEFDRVTAAFPPDSVGLVTPRLFHCAAPLALDCGRTLPGFELVYETYGVLNGARANAVLICHALSGDHHAAGYHQPEDSKPGWWDSCIGPGKPIDTGRFFVVTATIWGVAKAPPARCPPIRKPANLMDRIFL